jgi:hypothetical protein
MTTNQATQINNSTSSTSNQRNQDPQTDGDNTVVIHCDGAGSRPDGKGSGFAWIRPHTGERYVERVDGLTNNQAEYRALISNQPRGRQALLGKLASMHYGEH